MSVFVVDTNKTPLAPCHEAKARKLLDAGKAAIHRKYPFTIILKYAVESPAVPELRVKLDPGSRTTGIAVVDDCTGKVVIGIALTHRGQTQPSHTVPSSTLAEPWQARRPGVPFFAKQDGEHPHLGAETEEVLPDHNDQYGACAV
jgi:hypothetical protein